jgi:hypothetical protein
MARYAGALVIRCAQNRARVAANAGAVWYNRLHAWP